MLLSVFSRSVVFFWQKFEFFVPFLQPTVTKELIAKLQSCPVDQLTSVLQSITVWRYGKVYIWHLCFVEFVCTYVAA